MRWITSVLFGCALLVSCNSTQEKQGATGGLAGDLAQAIDGGEVIPYELRTAYIDNVVNQTLQPRITQDLTRKIKHEIEKRGRLLIVEDRDKAHVIVKTNLVFYKRLAVTYDTLGRPTAMNLLGAVRLKVQKREAGAGEERDLIDPTKVEARVHFLVRNEALLDDFHAIQKLTDRLAERIALTVETGWYTELKTDQELGKLRSGEGLIGSRQADPESKKKAKREEEIEAQEKKSLGLDNQ